MRHLVCTVVLLVVLGSMVGSARQHKGHYVHPDVTVADDRKDPRPHYEVDADDDVVHPEDTTTTTTTPVETSQPSKQAAHGYPTGSMDRVNFLQKRALRRRHVEVPDSDAGDQNETVAEEHLEGLLGQICPAVDNVAAILETRLESFSEEEAFNAFRRMGELLSLEYNRVHQDPSRNHAPLNCDEVQSIVKQDAIVGMVLEYADKLIGGEGVKPPSALSKVVTASGHALNASSSITHLQAKHFEEVAAACIAFEMQLTRLQTTLVSIRKAKTEQTEEACTEAFHSFMTDVINFTEDLVPDWDLLQHPLKPLGRICHKARNPTPVISTPSTSEEEGLVEEEKQEL